MMYEPFSEKVERPMMNERLRKRLLHHLRSDIEKLKSYTGKDFSCWNLDSMEQ